MHIYERNNFHMRMLYVTPTALFKQESHFLEAGNSYFVYVIAIGKAKIRMENVEMLGN